MSLCGLPYLVDLSEGYIGSRRRRCLFVCWREEKVRRINNNNNNDFVLGEGGGAKKQIENIPPQCHCGCDESNHAFKEIIQ